MMTRQLGFALGFAVTLIAGSSVAAGQAETGDPDAVYGALLKRYVHAMADGVNRVDYAAWRRTPADRARLEAYIAGMQRRRPSGMTRKAAFAYWVNLYNAVTLKVVLDRYPVRSIREIKSDSFFDPKAYLGPWRTKRVRVERRMLSLDDIEHSVLRARFKDPRVHYAVNCASFGCHNLMARPWAAARLEADLDRAARAYVNHPRGVRVIGPGRLRVSKIYQWFKADFGNADAGVLAHLRRYADPRLAEPLRRGVIDGYDYDWSLNELRRNRR